MSEVEKREITLESTDEGQYCESCGCGSTAPGEYCSFTQWLLDKNGMQDVSEAMEDLGKAFNKLILLNSRNVGDTDERKEVETSIIGCYQKIDVYYREYKELIPDADEDDEALNGVREYLTLHPADAAADPHRSDSDHQLLPGFPDK